jgi:hypothetical protein
MNKTYKKKSVEEKEKGPQTSPLKKRTGTIKRKKSEYELER